MKCNSSIMDLVPCCMFDASFLSVCLSVSPPPHNWTKTHNTNPACLLPKSFCCMCFLYFGVFAVPPWAEQTHESKGECIILMWCQTCRQVLAIMIEHASGVTTVCVAKAVSGSCRLIRSIDSNRLIRICLHDNVSILFLVTVLN